MNEAFLRLVGMDVDWADKAHFMAVASRQMRRLLVDYARTKRSQKRDGGVRVTLDEGLGAPGEASADMIDVDIAMEALGAKDSAMARLVELHYFGGLTYRELAEVTKVSEAKVHRDLRIAKAWLRRELGPGRESPPE